jgi:hypothetical protein
MACVVCDPPYISTGPFGRSGAIYGSNVQNFKNFSDLNDVQSSRSDNPYEIIHDSLYYEVGTVVA